MSGPPTPSHWHDQLPFSRPGSPNAHPPQIGFYGLGSMGYIMAANLANHPYQHPAGPLPPVMVYNRTRSRCQDLVKEVGEEKAKIAQDMHQLVNDCDVIITSLATDEVVRKTFEVFHEVLLAHKPTHPKIFVETSTIYPTLAGELDKTLSGIPHVHFITCPVFGPPAAAKKRDLVLALAGDYRAKKEIAYLLVPAVGKKAHDLGGNVEKAPTFKLIGNAFILGGIELIAETMTLAEKSGVGAERVYAFIKDIFPAPSLLNYAPKVLHDQFDGAQGFALDGGLKDAGHIRALTAAHNCPMPTVDIAHQHMLTARAVHTAQKLRGEETYDVLDWSALVAGPRLAAGLDAFDSKKHAKVTKAE